MSNLPVCSRLSLPDLSLSTTKLGWALVGLFLEGFSSSFWIIYFAFFGFFCSLFGYPLLVKYYLNSSHVMNSPIVAKCSYLIRSSNSISYSSDTVTETIEEGLTTSFMSSEIFSLLTIRSKMRLRSKA
jgi:hypothetical protein